jgi:hypothetical protein
VVVYLRVCDYVGTFFRWRLDGALAGHFHLL